MGIIMNKWCDFHYDDDDVVVVATAAAAFDDDDGDSDVTWVTAASCSWWRWLPKYVDWGKDHHPHHRHRFHTITNSLCSPSTLTVVVNTIRDNGFIFISPRFYHPLLSCSSSTSPLQNGERTAWQGRRRVIALISPDQSDRWSKVETVPNFGLPSGSQSTSTFKTNENFGFPAKRLLIFDRIFSTFFRVRKLCFY